VRAVRSTRHVGARTKPTSFPPESSARLDPLIGTVINGRYRVQGAIASGGMGRVYLAIQEPLGRSVALKVVRDDEDEDDAVHSQRRFRLEASILAQLQHPNIVTLHEFGEVEGPFRGRSFLAMELLEGRTLQELLDFEQRLSPARIVVLAEQMVRGLRSAHQRGIVHRDLKPSNVIVLRDDEGIETVKLVDFGIGKMMGKDSPTRGLTRTGAVMGTLGYIAPEQLHSRATPASDLFAVGVVLFEALTGKTPFDPELTAEMAGFAEPAPRLRDVIPDLELPSGLESLVASLLSRIPESRPTSSDVLAQLAVCRGSVTAPVAAVIPAAPRVARAARTRKSAWFRLLALALAAYAVCVTIVLARPAAPLSAPAAVARPHESASVAAPIAEAPPPAVAHTAPRRGPAPPARFPPPRPVPSPRATAVPTNPTTVFSTLSTE
jgi:predicted Ser/Thr protein kinase